MADKNKGSSVSIQKKIFSVFLVFVAFLIALLWLFQIVFLDDFYRVLKKQELRKTGDIIAKNIDNENLNSLIVQLMYQNEMSITLTDKQGKMLENTGETILPMSPIRPIAENYWEYYWHLARENGGKAFPTTPITTNAMELIDIPYDAKNFSGPVPRPNNQTVENLLFVQLVKTQQGEEKLLMLSTLKRPVDATKETLQSQLIIVSMILFLLALVISYFISKWVSKPIEDTNQAAKALSKAQYMVPKSGQGFKEIEELNETLSETAWELNKINHFQKELIANISHDLRTPLTMIGGYAEVMRDIPGEMNQENMQVIIDESKRLSTLVNAVMDYSKLQTDRSLKMTYFDITKMIKEVIQRYQVFLHQNQYQIDFEYEENIFVLADEVALGQVLYNLINNAISYTGESKKVLIKQEKINKENIKISVVDFGEGIAKEDLDGIWDRYYRASFHKRAAIGTGLGLSIVKSILDLHKVDYGVESEIGKGSIFWFYLPIGKKK